MLGFYSKEEDIIDILNPVISLLDGSMDFVTDSEEIGYNMQEEKNEANKDKPTYTPEKFDRDKEARYKKSPANEMIFSIKKKIILILSKILDF